MNTIENTITSKNIVEALRLVHVRYGTYEEGLVSLTTGQLLALSEQGTFSTMMCMPSVAVYEDDMQKKFGDEHSWEDLIELLKSRYEWESKCLPDDAFNS